jgi:putative ABC transport system permease protein
MRNDEAIGTVSCGWIWDPLLLSWGFAMNIFKMGWRNVWRNKRRSFVTIAAMTLALWVMLLYAGIIPGYVNNMEQSVTQLEVGDIQVHATGFLESPSLYTSIEDADTILAQLGQAGIAASPRLLGGGLAASGESSAGVVLRALDVESDGLVSRLSENVGEGSWLDPADPNGVVLGKHLAKTLGAKPGSELILVSQASDGSMANGLYTVRGVLSAVAQGTDRSTVLMNEAAFRELMVFPRGAHQIVVRRGELSLDEAARSTQEIADSHDVRTWKQLMPAVAQMFEFAKVMPFLASFIIYLSVGILILNAMLTAVFERIREFGVFKAIGAGPGRVLGLILVEGAIQTAAASVLGLLLALPAMWYLMVHGIDAGAMGGMDAMGVAMAEVWYGIYSPRSCIPPLFMLWFIAMGAVFYPAIKAAWINPVHAMRHR